MRHLGFLTLVAVLIAASACAADPISIDPTTPRAITQPSATLTTPTPITGPGSDLAVIESVIDAWFITVRKGDIESAWNLMSGRSQRSLGSIEMLESISTELAEGWAEWAVADNRSMSVVDRTADGQVSIITVRLAGTVTREGMTEDAESIMRIVQVDASYLVSPFEEFGNVANQVNADPKDMDLPPVPAASGAGRRIVYANAEQRVWLVDENEQVIDTYLVSGKNGVPAPGTYKVYSKSEIAYAGHDAITMRFMVRFTKSPTSDLAIGFHSIPYFGNGEPMQTEEQLGEYHSAGCVRQSLGHAAALYNWAAQGTVVAVLP